MSLVGTEGRPIGQMAENDLVDLANTEYQLMRTAADEALGLMSEALQHGIAVGDALLRCREMHNQGDWMEWLEVAPLQFSVSSAQRYMRWAHHKTTILTADAPLNTSTVVQFLKPLPQIPRADTSRPRRRQVSEDEILEMRRMYATGDVTYGEIAELFECSESTVCRYVAPGQLDKRRRYSKKLARQRREEREALREKEKAEAIRRAGGNISAAYSYVRKAAVELDAALGDATSPEVRTALRAALAGVHKAEDEIGKAVRAA